MACDHALVPIFVDFRGYLEQIVINQIIIEIRTPKCIPVIPIFKCYILVLYFKI